MSVGAKLTLLYIHHVGYQNKTILEKTVKIKIQNFKNFIWRLSHYVDFPF